MPTLAMFPKPKKPTVAKPDWVTGPVSITRDSKALERANFEAACVRLFEIDPHAIDFDSIRWEHWHCGFQEEIFVRPDSPCAQLVANMIQDLNYYPALDDDLFAEYEADEKAKEQEKKAAHEAMLAERRAKIVDQYKPRSNNYFPPKRVERPSWPETVAKVGEQRKKKLSKWEKKREQAKADAEYRLWASENNGENFGGEG